MRVGEVLNIFKMHIMNFDGWAQFVGTRSCLGLHLLFACLSNYPEASEFQIGAKCVAVPAFHSHVLNHVS